VYDSPTVGWVDATSAVPYLDVVASTSPDASTLYVIVVNRHFDRQVRTHINLANFAPAAIGSAFVMSGASPDANTGTTLVSAPGVAWATQAQVDPYDRFNIGSPAEVTLSEHALSGLNGAFDYTFPPASVTSLVLNRK